MVLEGVVDDVVGGVRRRSRRYEKVWWRMLEGVEKRVRRPGGGCQKA